MYLYVCDMLLEIWADMISGKRNKSGYLAKNMQNDEEDPLPRDPNDAELIDGYIDVLPEVWQDGMETSSLGINDTDLKVVFIYCTLASGWYVRGCIHFFVLHV